MENSLHAIQTWREEATQLMGKNQYSKAIPLLAQVAHFFEQNQTWEDYVDVGTKWAESLLRIEQHSEAWQLMEKVLKIALNTVAHKPALMAKGYHIMGKIKQAQAMYGRAINNYQNSLDIYQQILGDKNPTIADISESMGIALLAKGRYDAAIEQQQKSLSIRLEIFGKLHLKVAHAYNNLSSAYYQKHEIDRATAYSLQSLQIKQRLLGELNIDTAIGYGNLGACYHIKENYTKALKCQEKSLQIRLQLLGEQHIMVAQTYNSLGLIYYRKKNYDEAIEYFSKAIEITINSTNKHYKFRVYLYINISLIHFDKCQYAHAIKCLEKALLICQQKLKGGYPEIVTVYVLLAELYTHQNKYTKALNHCQLALQANSDCFRNKNIYSNPPLKGHFSSLKLLETLIDKVLCLRRFYEDKTHNFKKLQVSLETAYLADIVIEQMRANFYCYENSQLSLGKYVFVLSEETLETIWQMQEVA
jgi:tetratricopeptide (TPR) repeat protein